MQPTGATSFSNAARISVWDTININEMGNIIEIEWTHKQTNGTFSEANTNDSDAHKVINVSMGSCLTY